MANLDLILLHAPSVYDFRRESILYGPVSDLVPSTPVFEMYPIGFTTMSEYLERHGLRTRIHNLAVRMLEDHRFDPEAAIQKMDAAAFGIDLHWLPHAHGSVEIARIVKRLHPTRPMIFGGFSATYFHQELIGYDCVDFILRGDSTEVPLLLLIQYIRSGGRSQPALGSPDFQVLEKIPNLVWKDNEGTSHVNPITYSPDNLDDLMLDLTGVVRSVVRYRDLANVIPFKGWIKYPITAALTVRGCSYNCVTCGGSSCTFRNIHNRRRPAYRSPEKLAQDIRRMGEFSHGPVFILGDLRQAGKVYVDRFLGAIAGYKKPVMFEVFDAPPKSFFKQFASALPNFAVEISMESHDERVRRAFGRPYSNAELEQAIDDALESGASRFDLFFMIGLREQTYQSVMDTVEYSRTILKRYSSQGEKRVIPFISPMAPFLDPGSQAFEQPEKFGYHLFCRTLEEHRQALLAPSWKYVLNYETVWMNRDQIVSATYEAGRRMNLIKGEAGVITAEQAQATDRRIAKAVTLMDEIDLIVRTVPESERPTRLYELKKSVDDANLSTVCDKRELEMPMRGMRLNLVQAATMVVSDWWRARFSQR
ncbi:MAG TPA: TIGR04190 family B12-binding domain/radical SAM domain protein [Anaerolineaceae bacterium]